MKTIMKMLIAVACAGLLTACVEDDYYTSNYYSTSSQPHRGHGYTSSQTEVYGNNNYYSSGQQGSNHVNSGYSGQSASASGHAGNSGYYSAQ